MDLTTNFAGFCILALPFLLIAIGVVRRCIYSEKVDAVGTSSYHDRDEDGRSIYTNFYDYEYNGHKYCTMLRGCPKPDANRRCRLRINPRKPDKVDGSGMYFIMAGIGFLAVMATFIIGLQSC